MPHASHRKFCHAVLGGLVALCLAWTSAQAGILHIGNVFVLSGTNSSMALSDTNGAILSMTSGSQPGSIASSGEYGLWSLTYREGGSLNASVFNAASSSNKFTWSQPASDRLAFTYSNAAIVVTVTVSNRADSVDFSAQLNPKQNTVLEFALPGRLRFAPANLQRLIAPHHSTDGNGAAYKPAFFQSQPEGHPAGWTTTTIGPAGYTALYGGGLVFRAVNDPAAPLTFTTDGTNWLGASVISKWSATNAIVNRPPNTGQADLILVNSTNGAYFSASHLGGSGYLFRLGGLVDATHAPLSADFVVAAIEHLAQVPHGGRTNVALLAMERGPADGAWAAVQVATWRSRLQGSTALAQAGVRYVELSNVTSVLTAMTASNYLAILNPYGEWTPSLESAGIMGTVTNIGNYVRAGGNWFEAGGHSFYSAMLPTHYYSYGANYPPLFADFLQFETDAGNVALFGVQPEPATPWVTNAASIFVPGRLLWGGDATGGYAERAFATFVTNQTWQSPPVRFVFGHSAAESLSAYAQASGFNRTLADKMSAPVLDKFKRGVLVNYGGTAAQKTANLSKLPSPALVHFADYLKGGFDKQYPDHLPPGASFGTAAEFTNFLAQCRLLGHLSMPYSNPTWWCDHPRGPTFTTAGNAPLLVNLDGSYSYEIYGVNDGYTICNWHPTVRAANLVTLGLFVTNYPVDVLFEDQCGARGWQYDLNAASPTPYAGAAGMIWRTKEDSQSLPLSTENGWDRLVNHESQYSGMTWGLVPSEDAPDWTTKLRGRFAPETWEMFPLAQYLAHDKLSFIHHDLGQFVTTDAMVSWTFALGYGMSYRVDATALGATGTQQWLAWIDRVQKSVVARYVGQPVMAFQHTWGASDDGKVQAAYGPVSLVANLGASPLVTNGMSLAPYGFYATAPGMMAAHVTSGTNTGGVAYVVETNATGVEFWVRSSGDQSVTVGLPPGLAGTATVQLDGQAASAVQVHSNAFTLPLGLAPGQARIQPPAALAGPPSGWPGSKPAIGILNFSGMSSSWTTVSAAQWLAAFNQSALATQFGVPVRYITNYSGLALALALGPTNYLAIVNPGGEFFPEPGPGQWTNTLAQIRSYVNNGGSWWETAGYSFYGAQYFSGSWQTDSVGPAGMNYLGLPVGGGDVNQAAELLTVTPTGQMFFGPTLSGQLATMSSAVQRGLVRTENDPGHVTLLAGAQQDFIGGYRLDGWGYLWRIGGFLPNSNVSTSAVTAAMTYLYTNAPIPAAPSAVRYLWHGVLTTPPTIRAGLVGNQVSLTVGNCAPGQTNRIERTTTLEAGVSWQTVYTFTSPVGQTNWTETVNPGAAFYRVRSTP